MKVGKFPYVLKKVIWRRINNEYDAKTWSFMTYTYIFDTSALRSAKGEDLKTASDKMKIALSPITTYELLCHLDDTKKNGEAAYSVIKGNLMKCTLFEILHDPFAAFRASIGINNNINQTRFEEPHVLTQALKCLEESSNLEEFYNKQIVFPNGDIGLILGIAERSRKVFDEENSRYMAHVSLLYKNINDAGLNYSNMKAQKFIEICTNGVKSLAKSYTVNYELFEAKIFAASYPYVAYKLARLLEYQRKAIESKTSFCIDKNDTEDSIICLHLNLADPIALVTNDHGTSNALDLSFGYLDEVLRSRGEKFNFAVKVLDYETFQKRNVDDKK
jgi:hypothetical protein